MEAPQVTPGPRRTKLEPAIPSKDEGMSLAERDTIHGLIGKQVVQRLGSPARPAQGASPAGRRGPFSGECHRRQERHFLQDRPELLPDGRRRRQHRQLNPDDRAVVLTALPGPHDGPRPSSSHSPARLPRPTGWARFIAT